MCIALFYPFWPLFRQLYVHFSQNWDSDSHLRCLISLNVNWFKSYDTKYKNFNFSFFVVLYKSAHVHFSHFCTFCHNSFFTSILVYIYCKPDCGLQLVSLPRPASWCNTFSPIFPNFVYLLSTKPKAKWSRVPGQ